MIKYFSPPSVSLYDYLLYVPCEFASVDKCSFFKNIVISLSTCIYLNFSDIDKKPQMHIEQGQPINK